MHPRGCGSSSSSSNNDNNNRNARTACMWHSHHIETAACVLLHLANCDSSGGPGQSTVAPFANLPETNPTQKKICCKSHFHPQALGKPKLSWGWDNFNLRKLTKVGESRTPYCACRQNLRDNRQTTPVLTTGTAGGFTINDTMQSLSP